MIDFDCTIIGAGIIGLATARALAMTGRKVLIIERESSFGTGISARSSEVIHAGIYYPHGSLKSRLCIRGNALLQQYGISHQIPFRRCEKLIVATHADQLPALAQIERNAIANGVTLELLDRSQARSLEPALECTAALLSPTTGIIDTQALMRALLGDAERHRAQVAFKTRLTSARTTAHGIALIVGDDTTPVATTRWLINCGGLGAVSVARSIGDFPVTHIPSTWLAKGSYFSLQTRAPFSRLIYPIPESGGLGVHLTLDLNGQGRFGPDVEWIDEIDYSVDPIRAETFYSAIRNYWPDLRDGQLVPAYAGIRPKLSGPLMPVADFRIDGPDQHGVPGVINLFGIESPGITASLALAEYVGKIVAEQPPSAQA